MSISEKSIEKLEALAFLVAVIDGITEEEGWELNTFAGRIRGFYALRKAVEVHEKTGDIDKAMTHVSGAPVVWHKNLWYFTGTQKIQDEIDDAIKDSENPIDEYDALLKIKAAEINDEFDQKLSLMFIEDTISVDGTSDYEMRALLTLSRAWGISRFQVNKWSGNHFLPILERANKLEPDFDSKVKK